MSTKLLNEAFKLPDDGWYQIEASGDHLNPMAGIVQVIDERAVNSIVNRFNSDADAGRLSHGQEMLIDHEHFKHDPSKETIAYGWLQKLQNRGNQIFGKIRWTNTGKAAVEGGDYRFFSTEYDPADMVILNKGTPPAWRPLRLDGLTLTNQPNNRGAAPITNRFQPGDAPPPVSAVCKDAAAAHDELMAPMTTWLSKVNQVHKDMKKALGTSLGGHIDIQAAWEHSKRLHPDLHAAAYETTQAPAAGDDAADVDTAAQQLSVITNRLCKAGLDAARAYRFVQSQFPELFNRMLPPAVRVANRQKLERSPKAVKQFSATLLNRMIQVEMNTSGHPLSVALRTVSNREPVIAALASNQMAPIDVMVHHAGVWMRLQSEME